jgi:hypothetical protein
VDAGAGRACVVGARGREGRRAYARRSVIGAGRQHRSATSRAVTRCLIA